MPIQYRIVPGYRNYRVGNDGSFWSNLIPRRPGRYGTASGPYKVREWRKLKPSPDPRGYLIVSLSNGIDRPRTFNLHTLILLTFVGPRPSGHQCRHLNGIGTDNRLSNLRWGTAAENAADRIRHGTTAKGERQGRAKLTDDQVLTIRRLRREGHGYRYLCELFGVTDVTLSRIVNRRGWIHI